MPDVRTMRSSLAAFAVEVGRPLAPWQIRALALEARFSVIRAPRQTGKSRSLSVLALWRAFREPGHRVLIVSAGEEAARRLLAEVRAVALDSPLLASSVVDDHASLVTLANGSEVRSVPASERQVRGWTVDTLLIDEAAMVGEDLLLGAALPTTSARPDARIVLASSPLTTAGAFYDFVVRGEAGAEHVRAFRWRLEDADWITPSAIEAARESMSSLRFAAEFLGEWASGGDLLFPRSVLERVLADYALLELDELRGPCAVFAGADWGWTSDRSALVAVARLAGEPRFGVVCAKAWPAGTPGDDVIVDICGSPVVFDTITSEVNGLGAPLTSSLFNALAGRGAGLGGGARRRARSVLVDAIDVDAHVERSARLRRARAASGAPAPARKLALTTSAASKAAGYSSLRLLVDRGQLLIPRDARDLVAELLTLRVDLTASGTERIEAAGSAHDDLTDALVAALSPARDREGRWRTHVGELAAMRLPPPRLPDGFDLARLEQSALPDGERSSPRTPVWQSPRGVAVTLPAAPVLAAVPEDRRLTDIRAAVRDALTHTERSTDV